MDLRNERKIYTKFELSETEVYEDPFLQFKTWFNDAKNSEILEANAMILATATTDSKPSARVVLLKEVAESGFVFYTNYDSRKGKELQENPSAQILFYWDALERQIRIEGVVRKVSKEESEKYFNSRPEESRIGAIASPQSQVVPDRKFLDNRFTEIREKNELKMPDHWGGFILEPTYFEFWQGRQSRLHDRIFYEKKKNYWKVGRLAP
jgi:pyridoxamine 5'-phosphate oxidase